jgi:predicted acylesterase/phospholipase RssA
VAGALAAHQQIEDASDRDRMLRFGRLAIEADPFPEELWRGNFAQFEGPLPSNYACTAIDCETGLFTVWDASSNVPLDAAVASSCAAPGLFPAITINGRRYYDGGVCSATNAQLAQGYDKVLVLHMSIVMPDPTGGEKSIYAPDAYPAEYRLLLESGSQIQTIDPSGAVLESNQGHFHNEGRDTVAVSRPVRCRTGGSSAGARGSAAPSS